MANQSKNDLRSIAGQWRHENTGRLLVAASRLFEENLLEIINSRGFPELRLTHLAVPRNMDIDGTRITDIARRAGMTKQSMSELVYMFERMKLVKRVPDPDDRRAKKIIFTARGRSLMAAIRDAVALAEEDLSRRIGKRAFIQLRVALMRYTKSGGTAASNVMPKESCLSLP